jgi:leader peptidase (prepilin peptidase) / N-methyltransferase
MEELAAALPAPLVVAWVAILGGVVGSFLNVVIARVPAGESVVRPGSRCPACRIPIRWYDNVPVVSWLLLRARCRGCGTRISVRYPAVELAGVGAALLALWHRGPGLPALAEFVLLVYLLALSAIDLDTWLLPNALTWSLAAMGMGAAALGLGPARTLASSALGAGLGFATFGAVAVVGRWMARREVMGFGDVWLLCAIGAWTGAAALLPVVLLASLQGALVGLALIALGKAQPGPPAPPEPSAGTEQAALPAAEPAVASPQEPPPAPAAAPPQEPPPAAAAPNPLPEEEAWVPPRNAVPFGPFLALGAVEWLYLAGHLSRLVPALRLFR